MWSVAKQGYPIRAVEMFICYVVMMGLTCCKSFDGRHADWGMLSRVDVCADDETQKDPESIVADVNAHRGATMQPRYDVQESAGERKEGRGGAQLFAV